MTRVGNPKEVHNDALATNSALFQIYLLILLCTWFCDYRPNRSGALYCS